MTSSQQMPPNLRTLLEDLKVEIFSTLNCIQIGKIEKITAPQQTVEITIQIKRVSEDGTSIIYPVLADCPFFVLQGGGAYIDMPIQIGDPCIILFNDRNLDNWWKTGTVMNPADYRKHSFSDAIAIVGINPSCQALSFDGEKLRIMGGSRDVKIDGNSVEIGGTAGSSPAAARENDSTLSNATDDPAFVAWCATIGAALNALGAVNTPPVSHAGHISGGSTKVKIG